MAKEVIMPALGMAQDVGLLIQWLKAEGDTVKAGEPLMEIETDKATVEVEAPASGVLTGIAAKPGDTVPVGQTIALILAPGEAAPTGSTQSQPPPMAQAPNDRSGQAVSPVAARIAAEHQVDLSRIKPAGGRIQKADVMAYLAQQPVNGEPQATNHHPLASPKARRLAAEHQLDLKTIPGRGPEGAVLAADVLASVEMLSAGPVPETPAPLAQPQPVEVTPISRTWQVMVQRLTQSWTSVPHFYLVREVEAGALLRWRERAQPRLAEKLTYTDLLVKLVAAALGKHPRLNARWENGAIVANTEVNIGLAVAVEEGLLVPVIHGADHLGLGTIAARRRELVERANAGKLSLTDLQGGTFTISNLGMYGIDAFNAILNPPQAAILAVGRIADRVVPVDGVPAVRPMLTLTLTCDHRTVDGARGAQFLQTLAAYIEDPLGVLD